MDVLAIVSRAKRATSVSHVRRAKTARRVHRRKYASRARPRNHASHGHARKVHPNRSAPRVNLAKRGRPSPCCPARNCRHPLAVRQAMHRKRAATVKTGAMDVAAAVGEAVVAVNAASTAARPTAPAMRSLRQRSHQRQCHRRRKSCRKRMSSSMSPPFQCRLLRPPLQRRRRLSALMQPASCRCSRRRSHRTGMSMHLSLHCSQQSPQ